MCLHNSHIIAQLFVASFRSVVFASPIPLNRFLLIKDFCLLCFDSLLLVPTDDSAATSITSLTLFSEVLAEVSEYTNASISLAVFIPYKIEIKHHEDIDRNRVHCTLDIEVNYTSPKLLI